MREDMVVSIVVPVYNVYEYLDKCITSLIEQTYKNIQIILVDDGSNDGSSEICDKYAKADTRIIVIHQKNSGSVYARKVGTKMATGKYVLYVDSDDWIEKDRIEKFVHIGAEQNADMIYMDGMIKEYVDNSVLCLSNVREGYYKEEQVKNNIIKKIVDLNVFYKGNIRINLCMWAIKKELIQKQNKIIDNRIVQGDDAISVCACLLEAKTVFVMKECGYHYIQYRNSSITCRNSNLSNIENELYYLWNNFKLIVPIGEKEIYQVFSVLMNAEVAVTDYSIFFKRECDYLYPYSYVKKESNIVIYGAGKLGFRLVEALIKNNDYNIVAWVDKSTNRVTVGNYKIITIDEALKLEYDYIVIAILDYDIAITVKQTLLDKGIQEKKIACMDAKAISDKFLCMKDINIE